jgi:hypothetical protein
MATTRNRIAHKNFRLKAAKIKFAKRLMQAGFETKTIERVLMK